jgi:ubiquinone/menaquinone biosynthesis C-methylase UbiE
MDRDDPAYKGQAGYNPFLLAIYDPFVLGFMARAVWRCPTPPVVERYRKHLGRRHLDVGPGTGYFVEKAAPSVGTAVTLLDPNPHVLARCSRRLAAMHPTTIEADVMKPLPVDGPFDSAALNYVLHCLRGPQSHKAIAIRNVAAVLEPDGVLFGGTVLGTAERHTLQARAILRAFNRKGDFDNLGDTADGLRQILEESFQEVKVDVIGSVAHFTSSGPRQAG